MSQYAAECINCVPGIEECSYLELGVYQHKNFDLVKAKEKESVDNNPATTPTHYMTTRDFFRQNKKKYDLIFVDADHHVMHVLNDIGNSLHICRKMLFVHDLFPDNEMQACANGDWSGDGYKMLAMWLRSPGILNFRVLDCDSGLTVIKPPFPVPFLREFMECSYDDFLKVANENLKRLTLTEFMEWIKK